MPVTKWNVQVTKAEEIPLTIAKAFYIAKSGKPGPVLIDITKDAQFEEITYGTKRLMECVAISRKTRLIKALLKKRHNYSILLKSHWYCLDKELSCQKRRRSLRPLLRNMVFPPHHDYGVVRRT